MQRTKVVWIACGMLDTSSDFRTIDEDSFKRSSNREIDIILASERIRLSFHALNVFRRISFPNVYSTYRLEVEQVKLACTAFDVSDSYNLSTTGYVLISKRVRGE